ncbi:MAG: hypothetical protein P8Y70_03985 [Candidatus Lokiarchaeota archaeon]
MHKDRLKQYVKEEKEKLKRQRLKREEKKRQKKQLESKAKLPKEILKHITGSDQTVEELHESWFNRIRATIQFEDKKSTNFNRMLKIVKQDEEGLIGRKFELVKMFLALMFLSNNNRINLEQPQEFGDIEISVGK